ncbi:hypothetical protein SAMN05443377_102141 [Propionibacterium cyclohexanicum]|uniref:Uncharacterized protein n=2 Tax=Propionibacterium cyclohexanicum TaxID=64702 RepID=A0A1H9Q5G2_9ACTN|nr:hypothetical protein SAMN05443377_102141 [Propionibacterium cyclohexanicum]
MIVDEVVARLTPKLHDVQPDSLKTAVNTAFDQFAEAPVRTFLPILVERRVTAALKPAKSRV